MQRIFLWLFLGLLLVGNAVPTLSQQTAAASGSTTQNAVVPPMVSFNGVLLDTRNKPLNGVVGVTFALYKESQGGVPLWMETQNVYPDKTGRYTVSLGATSSTGLPADIFVAGEARWLGVRAEGQAEQARVLLLSVPYALKAGDAETIGGLPASAFVLAAPSASTGTGAPPLPTVAQQPAAVGTTPVTTAGGTINMMPKFDAAADITNSQIFDNGTNVGIGTTTPGAKLDVKGATTIRGLLALPTKGGATATAGFNSQPLKFTASVFNSGTGTAVPQNFQWQAEPVGNNTATASSTLNLLYATGTNALAETGLKIAGNGRITFASGQVFPGVGSGTVTSVGLAAPASDFAVTGSPVTGSGVLNLNWGANPPTSINNANAIVRRDSSGSFGVTGLNATGTVIVNTGNGNSIYAISSLAGATTILGYASASSGASWGVSGTSASSSGIGVYGSSPYGGYGVYGYGATGVYGYSSAANGKGVAGASSVSTGTAGSFTSSYGAKVLSGLNGTTEVFNVASDGSGRFNGPVRMGVETGTSQPPAFVTGGYQGVIVRRVNSTSYTSGGVVARSLHAYLERDGTAGGMLFVWEAGSLENIACTAISYNGSAATPVAAYTASTGSAGSAQVFIDSQAIVAFDCTMGNTYSPDHVTTIHLARRQADYFWAGYIISTYNQ